MRPHFISRLSLLIAGSFLVVATQVANWYGNTLEWLSVAGGVVMILIAATDAFAPVLEQRILDGLFALLGAYMIVEALAFSYQDLKWWTFGCACAIAALSTIGLAIHELKTEHVVHELNVTSTTDQETAAVA